jgi:hypothetical protein
VIVDQGAGGTGVVPYLPLDQLGPSQAARPAQSAPTQGGRQ